MKSIEQVRKNAPLVHHLTNQVVMNFTANGLLAFGGSPIMAKEPAEAVDMASIANGVLINIGTIVQSELEAMILAGKRANERGIPVVLDPVGVAASTFRKEAIQTLLKEIQFTAIKGNAGEMAYLADIAWETKGVESVNDDHSQLEEVAKKIAIKYKTLAVITSEIDVITDGETTKKNHSGHLSLTKITGAGCLLGSLLTAVLTTDVPAIQAAHEVVQFYGKAGEAAAEQPTVKGTGSFLPHFLDELGK